MNNVFTIIIIIVCITVVLIPIIFFIPQLFGNIDLFDTNYKFTKAITYIGDERIEIDIKKWSDYDGEQIQIIGKDGKIYLVSSFNTILINEGK